MKQQQNQKQTQKLKQGYYLSHQHMKLMHIMHLSGYALQEYIANELEQNPALEAESEIEPPEQREENTNKEEREFDPDLWDNDDDLFEKNYKLPTQQEEYYEAPVIQFYSLPENLKEQIHLMNLPEDITTLACYLADELEEDGYLRISIADAAYDYGFSLGKLIEEAQIETALAALQQCEPAGVGARNLQECLLLQLHRKKNQQDEITQLSIKILRDHYQHFVQRHFNKIKSELSIDSTTFESCIALISKLNPKPVSESNKYELLKEQIIPEFEVSVENDQLFVALTSSEFTKLRVNEDFNATQMKSNNETELKEASNYFQHLVNEANTLVNALKERETTMMNIITWIVKMQPDFFKSGDTKDLKPMILQDVAHATGYDISTVSRITSNKHVQTPFGIFALKGLFMRGLNAGDPAQAPTTAIRVQELITQIIKEEDKTNPLSDNDIVALLNKQGSHIARRTVVKYRESLSIPNSSLRKQER